MKLNSLKSAFSLVELSIVVLIMGATTASVVGTNNMMKKSRLVKAKSETSSSPVKNMNGLILWYEATMEASTNNASNGTNISIWNDLSPNKTNATQATSGNQPQYIDSAINKLPAIRFDGLNDLMNFTSGAIANNNYTIIIVEQRKDSKSNNYFLNGTGSGLSNDNLYLGYSDNSHIIHGQTNNYYTINTASYGFFSTPKIHIFTHNSNSGKKYYQNTGSLGSGTETPPKALTSYTGSIGGASSGYYYGDIGEIIVFNRTLSDAERKSIENYLAKKWYVNIQPGSVPTNTNSCPTNIPSPLPGISQTQVNNAGGNLSCSGANFNLTSSVSYTCSNGVFNATSSCSCITGYSVVGTACTPITCNITSVTELNNKTGLAYASSATAIPNSPTTACATGYTGSPTYTCTANGAANIVSNCTPITCTITSVTGLNNKTGLAYASSTTAIPNSPTAACATGYSGSPTYTCTANGAANIVSNCTAITCLVNVTGSSSYGTSIGYTTSNSLSCNGPAYTNTFPYSCTTGATINGYCDCSSGYTWNGSSCVVANCNIYNVPGIYNGQSVSGGTTSTSCNASGYSGSISYTCNGSFSLGSNGCTVTGSYNYQPGIGLNSSGSLAACQNYFNDCTLRTGDCSGQAYCGGGGTNSEICFGWEVGTGSPCSGWPAGRVWKYNSSGTSYGNWYPSSCTFNNFTGINNGTVVSYASSWTSQSCNAAGYSGSINYTCVNGTLNTSGSCSGCGTSATYISALGMCINNSYIYSGSSGDYTIHARQSDDRFYGYNGYYLIIQGDRNFVLYNSSNSAIWASGTNNGTNNYHRASIQADGNFVVYDENGSAVWAASGTWGNTGDKLIVGYNGKIYVVTSSGSSIIWSAP